MGSHLVGCHLTDDDRAKGRVKGNRIQAKDAVAAYAHLCPTIARLHGEGISLRAIADRLNSEGHRTRNGALWSSCQVHRVLLRLSQVN
ncbi:recombinase family protein [Singulisphaera rosea]